MKAPTPTAVRADRRGLGLVYATCVVLFAGFVTQLAIRHHFTIANFDDWKILNLMFTQPLLEWLFVAKNGHFMPATLYLVHLDYFHFAGRTHLLIATSFICVGLAIGGLWVAFRVGSERLPPVSRIVLAFIIFLFLWAASLHSFLWGLAVVNVMTAMWCIFAVACLVLYTARSAKGRDPHLWRLIALSACFAFLATFSFGTGVGAWASLLSIAIVGRYPSALVWVLSVAAGLCLGAYVLGISDPADAAARVSPDVVLRLPAAVLQFAASFVGVAVGRTAQALFGLSAEGLHDSSMFAGALGILGFAVYAARLLARPSRVTPRALLAVGLMTFAVFGGFVAAVARAETRPLDGVMIRFVIWSAIFWMGAAAALSARPDFDEKPAAVGTVLALLLPVVSLLMLPALVPAFEHHRGTQEMLARGSLSLLVGIQSDRDVGPMSPFLPLEIMYSVAARLERDHRGLFADSRAGLVGRLLPTGTHTGPTYECDGGIEEITRLVTRGVSGAVVTGHLSEATGPAAPSFVVIVDSAGTVRGLADLFFVGSEGPIARGSGHADWRGYIGHFRDAEDYVAHAVRSDGSVCRLVPAEARPRIES